MRSMKIDQFSSPLPLSIYIQNSYNQLTLNVQFQSNPSPLLQMMINQLKENIIQGCHHAYPLGQFLFSVSTH